MDAERLYQEHSPGLFRYLLRFTGDADAAADVVQETFVRLVEQPPRDEQAKSWLFKVATNLVRETGRTQSRRLRLLERMPEHALLGDAPPDPEAELEGTERRERVKACLATLPARQRSALLMRSEGFSHREIAEAIGTTTHSVGTILARAMERLARELNLDSRDPG